jgi:hypothetical protein
MPEKSANSPLGGAKAALAGSLPIRADQSDMTSALLMIARLPLSDVEKAEAVRRLLADGGGANA